MSLRTRISNSLAALLVLALATSCALSPKRPDHIAQPEISAGLTNEVFFGGGSTAAANVAVRVRNKADVPITVTSIEINSPDMSEWGLVRQTHPVRADIPAKSDKELMCFGTAFTEVRQRSEPLSFLVLVQFEAEGSHWQQLLRVMGTQPPRFNR
jgi:hypothetical protein